MRIPVLKSSIPIARGGLSVPAPQRDNSAYKTAEHKAWSVKVKAHAGLACQRCGRSGVRLYADHIKEISDGGTWDLSNGQALCGSCHTIKTLAERAKRFRL